MTTPTQSEDEPPFEIAPNRVLVVGAGKSGVAVARFCAQRGAEVRLSDRRSQSELQQSVDALGELPNVIWETGGHRVDSFTSADLIVVSPGVPELDALKAARARGVPVTGEIELASRFIAAPIVAVTGTNGKSTVTSLAGEMARQTGRPTFIGGNLGTPLITCVGTEAASARGLVVVELSSFQLETCERFHPRAAALLNLTPDHLERYASLDAYCATKLRIAQRMVATETLVVNHDDAPLSNAVTRSLPGLRPVRYSVGRRAAGLAGWVEDANLVIDVEGREERYPIRQMQLVGRHNHGNALASLLLMRVSALAAELQARAGLRNFKPLPHRMELVGEWRRIRFYDDSKATNVDSVVAGIDGFPTPFVLIAGGRDKGSSYAPLVEALKRNRCRGVILIGEATEKIGNAIAGSLPCIRAVSMPDAVARASSLARAGDSVVLSPACSSYDMFDDYDHRGRVFSDAVEALPS